MSLDGGARNNGKARPGSHAKEGSSFRILTLVIIPVLAIVIPASVAIYIANTSGGTSGNQPQSGAPLGSRPSSPAPSPTGGGASSSASAPTPTSGSGRAGNPTARHMLLYQGETFTLNNDDCSNHNNYPNIIFGPGQPSLTPMVDSPPSGTFSLTLFCSDNSIGSGLNPNLQYGGHVAIFSGPTDFNSCYLRAVNTRFRGIIPYGRLKSGIHLCILYTDDELALVTLTSVSPPELYRVSGTASVWQVLT
jgi:hypothetical protein